MAQYRRPPRENINGIVLLNKPAGVSSNGILQQVMRIFNAKKGGHTGALDPFATGLLPICLGEATKVSGLLLDSDKRYTATLKLGEQSDTGDTEGEIIQRLPVPELDEAVIEAVFEQFRGEIEQVPPMYSALKHQGKPLYYYARKGIEIDRPARPIRILALDLIGFSENEIVFNVLCSKGTYVRTLGEDIAKALGTVGHLTALHRTQTGSLHGDQMLTLEEIEARKLECLQPLDIALQHLQRIDLDAEQAALIKQGQKLPLEQPKTDLVRFYDDQGVFFAVGEWQVEKQLLKPKRVFNLPSGPNANAPSSSKA
ncbi:MAG: tRNA pseudouridine(55) synthase TruB [Thiomicrorhabdus chilensis]|uniref:tRNA pseudouridine(55) synthase TruB n=1 Tax=Thiomicrorhabdus chilensis TaxID=63656 RepID=UPI00299E36BE|nr:tRNA pseudouridine(55) synthase TruB [Thiomicrorhabdus chilensis]MDX1348461.1 tRNA pseudouridine(55) synthase TruB [Thiomicrorhabdus chilensis]